jgi:hypothetical protein
MPSRPTPDESRRGDVPAKCVRLSDGAGWGFLRPTVRLMPEVVRDLDELGRPVERVSIEVGFGYPPDIRARIGAVEDACARGPDAARCEAFLALAASLLLRVHDVTPAVAYELLSVPEGEVPRLVREVLSVVSERDDASVGV